MYAIIVTGGKQYRVQQGEAFTLKSLMLRLATRSLLTKLFSLVVIQLRLVRH